MITLLNNGYLLFPTACSATYTNDLKHIYTLLLEATKKSA